MDDVNAEGQLHGFVLRSPLAHARINGIDVNLSGSGMVGRIPVVLFAGYTWMNPVDMSNDCGRI